MQRWRKHLHGLGTFENLAPGGNPVHRLLGWAIDAILQLIETTRPNTTHELGQNTGQLHQGFRYVSRADAGTGWLDAPLRPTGQARADDRRSS